MPVSFDAIETGKAYSRPTLARIWGYEGYQAIARGVVTPSNDNKIILFVTEEKQSSSEPYDDELVGNTLKWEGPNDHFAESRILNAKLAGEEIHLFHRLRHHSDFVYLGQVEVVDYLEKSDEPSHFTFHVW